MNGCARMFPVFSLAAMPVLLGGCVANSSNPTVAVAEARMSATEALVALDVANPGGRDLFIKGVEYQLAHGEAGLPVAEGVWSGGLELPAGKSSRLDLRMPFSIELLEPESRKLYLNGTLRLEDRTGYLGLKFMDMTGSSFQVEFEAKDAKP
ncbi:MAG: hypothetical protein RL325_1614 [Planctomycetota bacterium]|jgi:hypothetical protein